MQIATCLYSTIQLINTWHQTGLSRGSVDYLSNLQNPLETVSRTAGRLSAGLTSYGGGPLNLEIQS